MCLLLSYINYYPFHTPFPHEFGKPSTTEMETLPPFSPPSSSCLQGDVLEVTVR